jgi:hypothetical protein
MFNIYPTIAVLIVSAKQRNPKKEVLNQTLNFDILVDWDSPPVYDLYPDHQLFYQHDN